MHQLPTPCEDLTAFRPGAVFAGGGDLWSTFALGSEQAVAGAIYSLTLMGISLNVYSQIGIILLIGLMAKNGILIVEFANQLRSTGKTVREAVLEASILRLRPIVMTVISTILGATPLVLASGAGAESRIAIGWVIVGGLIMALILTLFLTPLLYNLMAGLSKPPHSQALETQD